MTDLTFQTPDEARAWDMYVAGVLAHEGYSENSPGYMADAMILERRKRMALEKVTEAADTNFERRVSFVYGSLPEHSTLTKDDVRSMLKEKGS